MAREPRTFNLTPDLLSKHGAGQVLCLDHRAEGALFRLHEARPSIESNVPYFTHDRHDEAVEEQVQVVAVHVYGVLEQRAGYYYDCGGWTDGHDAIADRMIEALSMGDVVMVIDSPGGAAAGVEEAVRRVRSAKEAHGRRVYAYADELIGSAAYWWACGVADEIYVPAGGVVGSIGARSSHKSVAGAMAKHGVEVTYFAWPGEGKVAYAAEKPLSDVGRERAERDVALCGEAFAAAVAEGRGMSREAIVALNADCLTGKAAVSAGLADDVASLDDVIEHALAIASGEESSMATRIEEETEPEATTDDPSEDMEGEEPDEEAMEEEPEPDAEAEPDEDATEDEEEEEDAEEEEPKKKARARRPSRSASLAELAGLPAGASTVAIKNAVRRMRSTLDTVMTVLDARSEDELVGAAKAAAKDAERLPAAMAKNKKLQQKQRARRRMDAAMRAIRADVPGLTRGDLFIDEVDDVTGKKTTRLAPEWQTMKLEAFEAMVGRRIKAGGATSRVTTPFDASSPAKAKQAVDERDMDEAIRAAMQLPAVINSAKRGRASLEECARAYVGQFGAPSRGVPAP